MLIKVQSVILVFTFLRSCSPFALSVEENEKPRLTEYKNEITENGYFFKFSTSDGHQREERGEIVQKGDKEILVVNGFYTYIGDDEQEYFTEYESDENGYRAETKIREPAVQLPGSALASLAGGGLG